MSDLLFQKFIRFLFSIYFILATILTPVHLIPKAQAQEKLNANVDLGGEEEKYESFDADTGKPIICPKDKICSITGRKQQEFKHGPEVDLSDILDDNDLPDNEDNPFDPLPQFPPGPTPGVANTPSPNDFCNTQSPDYNQVACNARGSGNSLGNPNKGGNATPGASGPPADEGPKKYDQAIDENKNKLKKNKNRFENDRELHKAFVDSLNSSETYQLVGQLLNHGVAKGYVQIKLTQGERRHLNPYPRAADKEFYDEEVKYVLLPEQKFKNIYSMVDFHNKKLTEYLNQAYQAESIEEAKEIIEDYDFIEDELKLLDIIDPESKIIMPNVKPSGYLLQTDSRSLSGRMIRNIYNVHLANKSTINTYCKITADKNLCGGLKAGNEVTDLALHALDHAIVNNRSLNKEQLNHSARKIQDSIKFTTRLAKALSGQLGEEAKDLIDEIKNSPKTIFNAVYNYEETMAAVVNLYENKEEIFHQIGESLAQGWTKITTGTPEEKGQILGKVAFQTALYFVAPLKIIKGLNVADKAKNLANTAKKIVEPIVDSAIKIKVETKNGLRLFLKIKDAKIVGNIYDTVSKVLGPEVSKEKLAQIVGTVREASKKFGYHNLGTATWKEAQIIGEVWVGPGFRQVPYRNQPGKYILISSDGLKQYRPPAYKKNLNKTQANLQWKRPGEKKWENNGHLDIIEKEN